MRPLIAVPATLALVHRAWSRKSLTTTGIVVAALTAVIHAIHPWGVFFALLVVFFLTGTAVTKVKHKVKARLTLSSSGASGGEGARTHIQVLANSAVASCLILLHYRKLLQTESQILGTQSNSLASGEDLLIAGIVSNYAAVAADTFSSELGILSKSRPRLLTSWNFREVPPGTNGGVTLTGTLAGFAGAFIIALTAASLLPFSTTNFSISNGVFGNKINFNGRSGWGWREMVAFVAAVTVWGGLGSLLDSALGGWFQASVVDARTGKVVEGTGGKKVLVIGSREPSDKKNDEPSRHVENGMGILDNNSVNVLMAFLMSIGGMMVVSLAWDVPFRSIIL